MSLMWASHAHEEKGTFWHFSSFLIVYEHFSDAILFLHSKTGITVLLKFEYSLN